MHDTHSDAPLFASQLYTLVAYDADCHLTREGAGSARMMLPWHREATACDSGEILLLSMHCSSTDVNICSCNEAIIHPCGDNHLHTIALQSNECVIIMV
jgi:hypothetical protein